MKSNSFMRNRKAFTTVLLFCTGFIASHPLVVSAADKVMAVQLIHQQQTIKGIVVDASGEPVIGANVVVEGTTMGTITDFEGTFSISVPKIGKGAWPAIWTLGSSMEWPSCGEIDIMEFYRKHGIPHILANAAWGTDRQWNAKWNSKAIPFIHFLEKNSDWASEFHIWRMDWDEEAIRLYLDDELLNEILLKDTYNGSIGSYKNPFMQPQYILLNLAVGGINGGEVEINTYPIRYEIDYVRVYQKK